VTSLWLAGSVIRLALTNGKAEIHAINYKIVEQIIRMQHTVYIQSANIDTVLTESIICATNRMQDTAAGIEVRTTYRMSNVRGMFSMLSAVGLSYMHAALHKEL
jgi:hypothetical protein